MELTYRQKQQLLVSYRNDGYELQVRLNAKGTVLDAEIVRIELLMDESAVVEVIAPIANDVIHEVGSPTEQVELEPGGNETFNTTLTCNQADNDQLAFNQTTNAILPLKLVLWTLAIIIVPAWLTLEWLLNTTYSVVKKSMPLVDVGLTATLEGLVWLVEIVFGDSYDEHSDSYLEIKHLLR